jgi:hypothetical protein
VTESETEILTKFPEIQVVVRGEGEAALLAVLDALAENRIPAGPGIYTRGSDGVPRGEPSARIGDLDSLSAPVFQDSDSTAYNILPIATSRGCSFACSFCEIVTTWGRRVSYRSIDSVVREIEALVARTGQRSFQVIDDTFTQNPHRVLDFCRALQEADLDIDWTCFSRIDTIEEAMMENMAAAGCRGIFFGIDTGTEFIWHKINKRLSRAMVLDVVRRALQYMGVTASYIWGYPTEDFGQFAQTVSLAHAVANLPRRDYPLFTQLHFLAPSRATSLFRACEHQTAFSEEVCLEVLGGATLRSFSGLDGYESCLALIREAPRLFAGFRYYRSPDLERKWEIMLAAQRLLEDFVGRAFLSGNSSAVLKELRTELRRLEKAPHGQEQIAQIAGTFTGNLQMGPYFQGLLDRLARDCDISAFALDGDLALSAARTGGRNE